MNIRSFLVNLLQKFNKYTDNQNVYGGYNGAPQFNIPAGYSVEKAIREYKGWVYALSILNGRSVASTPFHLYVKAKDNSKCLFRTRKPTKQFDYLKGNFRASNGLYIKPSNSVLAKSQYNDFEEVIEDHPVMDVLRGVNPWQNSFEFLLCLMVDMQLTGNAYIYVVKDSPMGLPTELWSIPAWRMRIVPGISGEPFIKGYKWQAQSGRYIDFLPEEIIHIRNTTEPEDRLYGQGFVEAAWDVLKVQNATNIAQAAWLENLARPDYLINLKGGDDDSVNKLQARINVGLRGPRNTGRMIVGGWGEDLDLHQLNFKDSAFDAGITQFGQTARSPALEMLAAIWGVPMSMILANDPNRANAMTGEYFYATHTLQPFLSRFEDAFNEFLLPMFGIEQDAFIAFENTVPVDKIHLLNSIDRLMKGGAIFRNELRVQLGMDPMDEFEGQVATPTTSTTTVTTRVDGDQSDIPGDNTDTNNTGETNNSDNQELE